jgi:hypothetical protein
MPGALLLILMAALLFQQPATVALRAQGQAPGSAAMAALDYEYFKTKVQPIFMARREGHTRCASCHMHGTPMRLQELAKGATTWTEEQSKRNFQVVAARVIPHSLSQSKLLIHPLVSEIGGTFYHSGGKHWNSFLNPEWQVLANWVCGRKANEKQVELTGGCGGE